MTSQRRIAFGAFDDWEPGIRRNLAARYAPSFVDLAEIQLEDFDAVVPLGTHHYPPLRVRPDLRGRKFFHPSREAMDLCQDKLRLSQFLIDEGFGDIVPALRAPGPPYPYIWKRRRGGWGRQCRVVQGPDDERDLDLSDEDWFAQAVAVGRVEFATYVLRTGGQVRYVSTFIHQMAGPMLVQGEPNAPTARSYIQACDHLSLFENILTRLDYEGTACFDYKLAGGKPVLFEINPRYGASLFSDVNAYLDAYLAALAN